MDMPMPGEMPKPGLPRITDVPPVAARPAVAEPNPLFGLLVQSETDVVGLVAYGLYKQNKRDWLIAHRDRAGREPAAVEIDAFIQGESLPRRIATYRRLAEDVLAAEPLGKDRLQARLMNGLMAQPANDQVTPQAALAAAARKPVTWTYIAFLLAMLVAMAILFRFAAGWLFGTGR